MKDIYLVTGAAGNLGSSVTRLLVEDGRSVRALVLPGDPAAAHLPDCVEICEGDVRSPDDLRRFFDVPEDAEVSVIHLAGIVTTQWEFSQRVYDINVTGTKNIVRQCVASRVKKLVYVSSVHAITELPKGQTMTEITRFEPDKIIGFYGKTKAEASQIVMDAVNNEGLDASIVFPSGLCGPGDHERGHVTQLLIDCVKGRLPAGVRGGYDFVDVRDAARGVVLACCKGRRGEGYILGNRYLSVGEILSTICEKAGVRQIKTMLPIWCAKAVVPFFGLYYKIKKQKPLFTRYSLYTLSGNSKFSIEKAKRELGYTVRPFTETVSDALRWMKAEKIL